MTALTPQYTHLYYTRWVCWDYCEPGPHDCDEVIACPISRITAKRIYFHGGLSKWDREQEYFVDRAAIEREGKIYHHRKRETLHLAPPELPNHQHRPKPVAELRREMADLHPDRGGDPAEFRAAHAKYARAKGMR